jgi:hypothetical protein
MTTEAPPEMSVISKIGPLMGLYLAIAHDAKENNDVVMEIKGEAMAHGAFAAILGLYGERTANLLAMMGRACLNVELEERKAGRGDWLKTAELASTRPASRPAYV